MNNRLTACALAVLFSLGGIVYAQQERGQQRESPRKGQRAYEGRHFDKDKMKEHCHRVMEKHRQMREELRAKNEKLDSLVARMNQATGDEKVEAMAAVINEAISQRKEMLEIMSAMHHRRMRHMMEHMERGENLSQCTVEEEEIQEPAGTERVDPQRTEPQKQETEPQKN